VRDDPDEERPLIHRARRQRDDRRLNFVIGLVEFMAVEIEKDF
jgi:hypothetical protein